MAKSEYHFVITLQFRKEGEIGNFTNTVNGTVAARRGDTGRRCTGECWKRRARRWGRTTP